MELTKEECSKTLNELYIFSSNAKMYYADRDYHFHVLKQLIVEHFDNPPLKFEELHEGMWVWDNKYKVYNKVRETYTFNGTAEVVAFVYLNLITQWNCSVKFEENRFYRKEVKE